MLSEAGLLHIEDLYVLTDGLKWVIVELEAQLRALTTSASCEGSLPQHIDRASQIWNEVFRLLDAEDIFGYWTPEHYIESRTVENFHDIRHTLDSARVRIRTALEMIPEFEYVLWLEERRVVQDIMATEMRDGDHAESVLRLKVNLVRSELTRAEARDTLQNVIANLSTFALTTLRYRPLEHIRASRQLLQVPTPLPPIIRSVKAFLSQHENPPLPLPAITQAPHGVDDHECLICRKSAISDPERTGQNAKPQLLIYTSLCCGGGPFHVSCMFTYLESHRTASDAPCPTCHQMFGLGREFSIEVMERRILELGTL
jgi:hypothetical protein